MNGMEIALIVVTVMAAIAGIKWAQVATLLREAGELLLTTSEAMEDKKITKDEAAGIVKELADVLVAGKKLLGK